MYAINGPISERIVSDMDGWMERADYLARRATAHFDEAAAIARHALCARDRVAHLREHPAPVPNCWACTVDGGL